MEKKIKYIRLIYIIVIIVFVSDSMAQEIEHHSGNHHLKNTHRITPMMAYAFINNSFIDQSSEILIAPALGLNYDYFINSRWGLGLHSEILLQQFKYEHHGNKKEVVRENPVGISGVLLYKPHHRWTIFTGYGIEIEKNENIDMIKLGTEYGIEMAKNWEVGFSLEFDFKPNAYNSLLFGIGFSKIISTRQVMKNE